MKNDNVFKITRVMMGGSILTTCEDCTNQRKKLFSENKCALIEYAEALDKRGYRRQEDTIKEFAAELLNKINNGGWSEDDSYRQGQQAMAFWVTKYIKDLVEHFSKED